MNDFSLDQFKVFWNNTKLDFKCFKQMNGGHVLDVSNRRCRQRLQTTSKTFKRTIHTEITNISQKKPRQVLRNAKCDPKCSEEDNGGRI